MFEYLSYFFTGLGIWVTLCFIVPFIIQCFIQNQPQDLKRKYNSKWAVVTGASSGIGRAITEKLASQGINVVLVALDNELLKNFHADLKSQYPKLEFRAVGVDLSNNTSDEYMNPIKEATQNIDVNLLFNNAGYIQMTLFADSNIENLIKNFNTNCTAIVKITHYFLPKMLAKNLKGAIFFTSSPAGLIACPFSVIYGATKAFVTEFATSIAPEVYPDGIDILVIHPSPVDTLFYSDKSTQKSDAVLFFKKTVIPPTTIANTLFASVGRGFVVRDQGYFSIGTRLLLTLIPYNLFSALEARIGSKLSDYKNLKQK